MGSDGRDDRNALPLPLCSSRRPNVGRISHLFRPIFTNVAAEIQPNFTCRPIGMTENHVNHLIKNWSVQVISLGILNEGIFFLASTFLSAQDRGWLRTLFRTTYKTLKV